MRSTCRSLSTLFLVSTLAACGGGGGGGSPEPSVIRRMGLVPTASTRLGESSCAGDFDGDGVEEILAVGSPVANPEAWSIYRVDPFAPDGATPVEIPGAAAFRIAWPPVSSCDKVMAFDADQDGADDLLLALPASGALFVVFHPLSPAATVAGPFTIPDGPLSTPHYGTMVLRRNRDHGGLVHGDIVVVGMPDALGGRGQVALLMSGSATEPFGAHSLSAPFSPPGLDPEAAFGRAFDGFQHDDGRIQLFVGAPGDDAGAGAVYSIVVTVECVYDVPTSTWTCTISVEFEDGTIWSLRKLTPSDAIGAGPGLGSAVAFGSAVAITTDVADAMQIAVGAPDAFGGEGAVLAYTGEFPPTVVRSPAPGRGFGSEMDALHIDGDGNETLLVTQPNCESDGSGAVGMRINWDLINEQGPFRRLSEAPTGSESTICAVRKCIPRVNCVTDFIAWFEGAADGSGVLAVRDLTDKRRIDYVAPKTTP